MSDDGSVFLLNQVEVQRRIKHWLGDYFHEETIELEFDTKSLDTDKLHFYAFIETGSGVTVAPNPDAAAREAVKRVLGPAFWIVKKPTQLDIYAQHPSASDATRLQSIFARNTQQLMQSVWPVSASLFVLLLSFVSACYFAWSLHEHWSKWESPWETLFHWVFSVFIYLGGRIFSSASIATIAVDALG